MISTLTKKRATELADQATRYGHMVGQDEFGRFVWVKCPACSSRHEIRAYGASPGQLPSVPQMRAALVVEIDGCVADQEYEASKVPA